MPFDHLIAVSKLQSQIGITATPKEMTWFIILVIVVALAAILKRLVF